MPGAASASVRDLTPPRGVTNSNWSGGVQKKVGVLTPPGGVAKSLILTDLQHFLLEDSLVNLQLNGH